MRARLSAFAAVLMATWAAACGGGGSGSDLISEDALRNCLADAGLGATPPAGAEAGDFAPLNLRTAPDFTAYAADGAAVDLVVEGSAEKARRTAADVRGALGSLGVTDVNQRLIAQRNAIAVFHRAASSKDRATVRSCMG